MNELIKEVNEKYELLKTGAGAENKIKPYYLVLKYNSNLVDELYTRYKSISNEIKLYKLNSGKFKLIYGKNENKYNHIMTAKICFIILYELLILLNDENIEYFMKSTVLLISSLELEK